ncbi:HD-GYP domain-containing protein [Vibrio algarum]|uniref:HD domain-containing protein n=1 Tax=Vibrio algarum TaxID=3020714 RepID=A0ABT4YW16_9VIBR|nr:HD domain-containing phosphohydrolase [Vibrio sp. KJ40-1]MDB1125582.1 HD domain-containing protein [Vibrio sp. KJ40-1]
MKTFTPVDLDNELLLDVVDEVEILCENSASTLVLLSNDPDNRELLDKLFRSVHTIKGDVGLAQFSPLLPLLSALEDILGFMRQGAIQYNTLISDLLLSIIEEVKSFVDDIANAGSVEYDSEMYSAATEMMAKVQIENLDAHEALLTKSLHIIEPPLTESSKSTIFSQELDDLSIDWSSEVEPDLMFFQSIMKPVEDRLDNWDGRSGRQLKLALLLNQFAGKIVDEKQLRAAVYLHDLGMSLLPLTMLRQKTRFTDSEKARLRGHVQRSVNFLSEMPHWSEARQFIYEHHERADGQGYPQGLSNIDISHGAKILALVDAFEAMTHTREYQVHTKRHISHALQEINSASGTQFCPYWVNILNKVMASIMPN